MKGQLDDIRKGIPRRPPGSAIPLSFPQQRQLFLELLERDTAVNNLSFFLEINGKLDISLLEQSANQIMARHEALRTRFSLGMGMPVPEILDEIRISIPLTDLQRTDEKNREAEARRLAEREVQQPFDLSQAPLIRLRLYHLDEEKYFLLLTAHHCVSDGWSLGVLLRELMMFYQGQPAPELPLQYSDYAFWQNDENNQRTLLASMPYWKEQLGGELPVLELPADHARGARQSFSGGTYRFVVSKETTEALERLSREEDATLFMTLLTVFYLLLHRYSGQDDILIGTPVANRNFPELEPLIGVFINTLALRADLSGDPDFKDLLRRVRDIALDAYARQDMPFEKLVEALRPRRDLSRTPVFQVVFNLQNSPLPRLEIEGLETAFREIDRGVSQFDLTLMVTKTEGQCHAVVEYNSDLFHRETIVRMFRSYQTLLDEAIAHPDHPVSKLRFVALEDLERLFFLRNQTQFEFPRQLCVHQLFEQQVEKTPDALALICGQDRLTYCELNRRANRLARSLQRQGIGPKSRVGIMMNRSVEMVEALLAVLKAGASYVPIHPSTPEPRVRYMLEDAQVRLVLKNRDAGVQDGDPGDLPTSISPDSLAYVMYTSGSTGVPKGVMVSHASLVNFLCSMREQPGIGAEDVLLAVTALSFDIAALELFLPLIAGARVVIADEEMLANPVLLAEEIDLHQISVMQATPATWQLLLEAGWKGRPGLKALCGGEALTRSLANRLLDRVGSLWNMYGPTETTVWSSINQIHKGEAPISIGQPVGNTQLYILDRYQQPLPPGVAGELHIGGEGLAEGYLNLPDLTEEKFIPDNISGQEGGRLYKTGDLARYLADDSIEVLGRMDDQVKIYGNRIELGEIAAVLTQHPAVTGAVVIARTEQSGDKRLIAYFTSKNGNAPTLAELREFISHQLPSYMSPAFFIHLEALPLSPNGKVDRKALPLPEDIRQQPGYVAPRNEKERILAEIWQNVLRVEQVGIDDNFFDLGGASMQSLQIVAKANMYGIRISVEDIFMHQTIAGLAAQDKE